MTNSKSTKKESYYLVISIICALVLFNFSSYAYNKVTSVKLLDISTVEVSGSTIDMKISEKAIIKNVSTLDETSFEQSKKTFTVSNNILSINDVAIPTDGSKVIIRIEYHKDSFIKKIRFESIELSIPK